MPIIMMQEIAGNIFVIKKRSEQTEMGRNEKNIKIKKRLILLAFVIVFVLPVFLALIRYRGVQEEHNGTDIMNKNVISRDLLSGNGVEGINGGLSVADENSNIPDSLETIREKNTINRETQDFIDSLKRYISGLKGCYGIYFIDLKSGLEFGKNGNDVFYAASTVKVPLALYLSVLMENGVIQPDKVLEYIESDYESGSGRLQFEEYGSKYTVKELISLSIRVSDNVATNMLLRMIGYQNLKNFMRILGGKVVDDEQNITCPKDMAIYLKEVYYFSQKSDYGKELVNELQNTVFNDRLPTLLPSDIKVAHKIGNWLNSYHDVGIVFTDNPYVISIMSKGVSENEAFKEIAYISRLFFDFFT